VVMLDPSVAGEFAARRSWRRTRRRAILAATRELLAAIAEANGIAIEDVASAFFTSTPDLRSAFPARAARDLGWTDVPLLGATEVDKPGAPAALASASCCTGTPRTPRTRLSTSTCAAPTPCAPRTRRATSRPRRTPTRPAPELLRPRSPAIQVLSRQGSLPSRYLLRQHARLIEALQCATQGKPSNFPPPTSFAPHSPCLIRSIG